MNDEIRHLNHFPYECDSHQTNAKVQMTHTSPLHSALNQTADKHEQLIYCNSRCAHVYLTYQPITNYQVVSLFSVVIRLCQLFELIKMSFLEFNQTQ